MNSFGNGVGLKSPVEHPNVHFESERSLSVHGNPERCFLFMEILIVFCSKQYFPYCSLFKSIFSGSFVLQDSAIAGSRVHSSSGSLTHLSDMNFSLVYKSGAVHDVHPLRLFATDPNLTALLIRRCNRCIAVHSNVSQS